MELRSSLSTPPARHLSYGLNPLISLLKEHQLDPTQMLDVAGIPLQALDDPTYELTPHQELSFTTEVIRGINIPEIGLIVGRRYHLSAYGLLGLAIMTSENLLAGMAVLYKNILMTWTYMFWNTTVRGDRAYVSLEKLRDLGGSYQYMVDRGLVASHTIFKEALGQELPVIEVHLKQDKPTYADLYTEYFKCPVYFNSSENYYAFDSSLLYQPLAQSEPETARIYGNQCEKICLQLAKNSTFSDIVRNHILSSPRDIFTLDTIADRLNMTARTVQRKLSAEGRSYKDILEDVRCNLAIEYLQSTSFTIEEIAVRLGYSDSSSFCHAYKRWTGINPSELRHRDCNINAARKSDGDTPAQRRKA
ncbi:putative HTH-type transcriptional regulator [Zhongshania aliphaticivorans]|uniref:Putative HTH-type transcriptional regulator n=1 Tax=Zhongshania aliphaticivorans TaxID=1470434 RepID=A0A5S9Q9Y8_9GAMM|nr:AraC family transcriptional regulator [Zhongshania aliphaticivorans]CAA0114639.1 putative HTH-type transcriptional regulator [Zhongshania aliphaticivorans]